MAVNFQFSALGPISVANGDETFLVTGNVIRSSDDGVNLLAGLTRTEFHNYGTVLAGNEAVEVIAQDSRIVNYGTIQGLVDGIDLAHTAATATHTIVNYGTITAGQEPIDVDSTSTAFDLFVTNAGSMVSLDGSSIIFDASAMRNVQVVNSGFMKGGELGMSATGFATLSNSGTINTTIINAFSGSTARITNTGEIIDQVGDAGGTVLQTGNSSDFVTNAGKIIGGVNLNGGSDSFRTMGDGFVSLTVSGGLGNDTLLGGSDNDQLNGDGDNDLIAGFGGNDTLNGGAGDDRVFAGEGDDQINGGSNNDTLNGQAGDDTIEGDDGNDVLLGQAGVDFLVGSTGNDTIDGGEGDDSLYGGADADVLRGRDGIDYIDGGLGRDVTEGGPGADIFIFNNVLDSTPDANRDVILDFESGVDTINLVNVIPGVFVFRGTAAFTSTAGVAELRLQQIPGGSTIIQMDTNGDGTSDMEIRTAGAVGLTINDFDL